METLNVIIEKLPVLGGWAAVIFLIFFSGKKILELVTGVHKQSKQVYQNNTADLKSHQKWLSEQLNEYRNDNSSLHREVRGLRSNVLNLEEQVHGLMVEVRTLTRRLDSAEEENQILKSKMKSNVKAAEPA